MKTLREKIAIMQAAVDGKEIQVDMNKGKGWEAIGARNLAFDWIHHDYRVVEDMELKAFNSIMPGYSHHYVVLSPAQRAWMRNIINAVKAGEIT